MKQKVDTKKQILIIGAGPAGMAAAMGLSQQGRKFIVVEKDTRVGGLSKTYQIGNFRTDNGPHRFFSKNPKLYEFIEGLLNEKWIRVKRHTRFFINGRFYHWPIKPGNVLLTMEKMRMVRIIGDFLIERVRNKITPRKPKNFEEFAVSTFGRSLAEFNMLHYNAKIWGIPPTQMSVDWSTQRIPNLSITSLIKGTLLKKFSPRTMTDEFYYPESGTGLIYDTIAAKIKNDNPILLNTTPTAIKHDGRKITSVTLSNKVTYSNLEAVITSIPITTLVSLLDPPAPKDIQTATTKLRFRAQVYLFLTIDKPSVSLDQWIYFPDKDIPFGRISEMKNFSPLMAPKTKTSLFVEYFCWEGDTTWTMSKNELEDLTVTWLEKLGFIQKSEVIASYIFRQPNVYPVYDLAYKKHLKAINKYLDHFTNLANIGRPGRFRYTNQDHSLEMGLAAATAVVTKTPVDFDAVGSEEEYQEKGRLRIKNQPSPNDN